MKRKPSLASLTRKLDKVFSLYIRRRDANSSGYGKCVTCGRHRLLQCGHFQRRQHKATRWDERNCAGQCSFCNHPLWGGGEQDAFALALERQHGASMVAELRRLARTTRKFSRDELEEMIERYKC